MDPRRPSRRLPPSPSPPPPAKRRRLALPLPPPTPEHVLRQEAANILNKGNQSFLVHFLRRVTSDRNVLTSDIELYRHLVDSPFSSFISALMSLIRSPWHHMDRFLALDTLSSLIPRISALPGVPQKKISGDILRALEKEKSASFLQHLCAAVKQFLSHYAKTGSPGSRWPELFHCLFQSENPKLFEFLGQLICEYGSEIRTEAVNRDSLHDRFSAILDSDAQSLELKIAAVAASVNFLVAWGNIPSDDGKYHVLASKLARVTGTLNDESRAPLAKRALLKLVELARYNPEVFGTQLAAVYEHIFMVIGDAALCRQTDFDGVEFVLVLAERGGPGQEMLRGSPILIEKLIWAILSMLCDANETGRLCLARLIDVMGGDVVVQTFPEASFGAENWQIRHAAVTSLSILAGTAANELKQKLYFIAPNIVDIVQQGTQSVLRLAALCTIKELSEKLGPEFQEKFHQQVFPALVMATNDSDLGIKAQAALAMVCFSENCSPGTLETYMDYIMPILIEYLQTEGPVLKEKALETLLFLADSAKDHIQNHYNDVKPFLIDLMTCACDEKNKALLAASLNYITMAWVTVGKEKISDDIDVVVPQLILWQGSEFSVGDPMRTALVEAWGRICRCLGQEFQSHMPSAIRFLLASAGCTSSNVVDQSTRPFLTEQEKVISCNVLCLCAAELKGHFHPWISEVAATLVPLLEGHSNTRTAAVSCMYSTLRSYEAAVEEGLIELIPEAFGNLDGIIHSLLNAFEDENSEIKMVVAKSIGVCAQCGGSAFGSHFRAVISCFITVMEKTKESCEKELWLVHDNAVSALGKVLQFHGDKIEASEVFNTWLNHLPLKYDREEAKVAHHCLCLIVEKIHAEFCDPNDANLCRIMAIYAEILWGGRVIATEGIVSLIIDQGKRFRERFRGDGWNSIMSSVKSHLRLFLRDKLSS